MRRWISEKLMELSSRIHPREEQEPAKVAKSVTAPRVEVDDSDDGGVPWPPVALSEKATLMVRDGLVRETPFEIHDESQPLEGSVQQRIQHALSRARTEF